MTLPFDGLKVVEIGTRVGATVCGSLLSMAGADVIFVEPENSSPIGKYKNRAVSSAGKSSLVIRDGSPESRSLLRKAIAGADVVIISSDIESFEEVKNASTSQTIICDVTALPNANEGASILEDKLVQALSGIAAVTGTVNGKPTVSEAAILEIGAGIYAASAVASAVRVRRLHGGGQCVSASLYGTGVNGLVTFLPFHFAGKIPPRGGNRHPMCAPWNAYQAQDGWLLLCSANDEQWRRLCGLMGRPELAAEGDLAKLEGRVRNVDKTDAVVQAWISTKSVDEAVKALGGAEIAAGPIIGIADLPQNENVAHRRMVRRLHDPETGSPIVVPGSPLADGIAPASIPERNSAQLNVAAWPKQNAATGGAASEVKPLSGIRVLEIGQYTTAPLAAKQMATLGAEVIKIEPVSGESSRAWPPHLNGESYFFTLNNANKTSLAVDLRTRDDRGLFAELLRTTDVLVENLKPGSLARLGFSYAELTKINPRIVYCAISGYGIDSVYPGRPAFDTVVQAMSGLMDLTRAEGVPTKIGVSIADTLGGMMGLYCILAKLELRDRTGVGSAIDLAMQDVAVWATHPSWNPADRSAHSVLTCRDGHVVALIDDAAANSVLAGAEREAAEWDRADVVQTLAAAGIAAAPVSTVDEVGSREVRDGGMVRLVDAGPSRWPMLDLPFTLSRMRDYELKPIGALGAANKTNIRHAP